MKTFELFKHKFTHTAELATPITTALEATLTTFNLSEVAIFALHPQFSLSLHTEYHRLYSSSHLNSST